MQKSPPQCSSVLGGCQGEALQLLRSSEWVSSTSANVVFCVRMSVFKQSGSNYSVC